MSVSVESFVSKTLTLIEKEREAEIEETRYSLCNICSVAQGLSANDLLCIISKEQVWAKSKP